MTWNIISVNRRPVCGPYFATNSLVLESGHVYCLVNTFEIPENRPMVRKDELVVLHPGRQLCVFLVLPVSWSSPPSSSSKVLLF